MNAKYSIPIGESKGIISAIPFHSAIDTVIDAGLRNYRVNTLTIRKARYIFTFVKKRMDGMEKLRTIAFASVYLLIIISMLFVYFYVQIHYATHPAEPYRKRFMDKFFMLNGSVNEAARISRSGSPVNEPYAPSFQLIEG